MLVGRCTRLRARASPAAQADAAPLRLTGISGDEGGGRPTPELIKQTILPKCVQVPKRRRPWSARARQHGPRTAGRRLTDDVSDRTGGDPRRQRRAPEDGGQRRDPGLWAEDRGTVGQPLMEAHYLKTVWQDCPANERLVAEYPRNVL